jgi:hypothetical protein
MLQLLLAGSNLNDTSDASIQTAPKQIHSCKLWKLTAFALLVLLVLDLSQKFM